MKVKMIASAPESGEFLAEWCGDWLRVRRTDHAGRMMFGKNAVETTAGRECRIFEPLVWMEVPDELCEVSDG